MYQGIVPPSGPVSSPVMIVGEAPGETEYYRRQPFVGRSRDELDMYFNNASSNLCFPSSVQLHPYDCYMTNVVKVYTAGNPTPDTNAIEYWTDCLLDEIDEVEPHIIIAVGKIASNFFIGGNKPMRMVHGRPCRAGEFDHSLSSRSGVNNSIIISCYHPAFALRSPKAKPAVFNDYAKAIDIYHLWRNGCDIHIPVDKYIGHEEYHDADGKLIRDYMASADNYLAIDTESNDGEPWSLQISHTQGTGLLLRRQAANYRQGISSIQRWLDQPSSQLIIHFGLHDEPVLTSLGLDISNVKITDTSSCLYILHEPQSLKFAAWRWCGASMMEYQDMIGDTAPKGSKAISPESCSVRSI